MYGQILTISLLFLFPFLSLADNCEDWFKNSKIPSNSRDCELVCLTLEIDMSTFTCHNKCEKFCKASPKKCTSDPYWKSKIKIGRPTGWDIPFEKTSNWKEDEKEKLTSILDRLPENMKSVDFEGFYRMTKSIDRINPATTADSGKVIVIYDNFFENLGLGEQVITHELGHVMYLSLSRRDRENYKNTLGWKKADSDVDLRPGNFISSRAKDNADEDFAENISYFLNDSEKLKSQIPTAYKWIQNKFSKNFKLKEACQNEKPKK